MKPLKIYPVAFCVFLFFICSCVPQDRQKNDSFSSISDTISWNEVSKHATEKGQINAISLLSGAYMVRTPASYTNTNLFSGSITPYAPEALFDQSNKVWCSASRSDFPHVFIMELTEEFIVDKLIFNNKCEENWKGISTKELIVEFSTQGPEKGYSLLDTFELKKGKVSVFEFEPCEARWVRISILSNYGNKQYTELAEIELYGYYKHSEIRAVNIEGRWDSNWEWIDFEQNGTSISGNYKYHNGKVNYGGVNRNKITYKWYEKVIRRGGWTTLFMNQEGTRLTGVWCYEENWNDYGFWIMERKEGVPFELISQEDVEDSLQTQPVNDEVVKEMTESLKEDGKLVLYGINFKTDSWDIETVSNNTLNELAEVLKNKPNLQIEITGHTDNSGTHEHNMNLSTKRALAVKAYLTSVGGINENRMEAIGRGEDEPIASNSSEMGKAANRRVEIKEVR